MHWPSITRQRFVAESFLQRPVRVRRLPCPRRSVGKLDLPWRRRGLMHQLRPRLNRVNGTGVTLPPVASVRGVGWASSGAVPTRLPAEQAFGGEGTGAGRREETTAPLTAKLDWAGSCKVPKAPCCSTAAPWRWTVGLSVPKGAWKLHCPSMRQEHRLPRDALLVRNGHHKSGMQLIGLLFMTVNYVNKNPGQW